MIKKMLKIAGKGIAVLVGLAVVAFFVLKLVSDDQYRKWITSAVQSATDRDFSIETLELDLSTSLLIEAKGIRMANADWSETADMVSIDRLEAEVDLISLIMGVAEIRAIVEKANILAETSADGVSNFAMGSGATEGGESAEKEEKDRLDSDSTGLPLRPLIREIRIEDSTFTLVQGLESKPKTMHIANLLVETPTAETTLSLAADVGDIPVNLSGNLGNLDVVLDQTSSAINIDGSIESNTLGISGTWGPLLPELNMDLGLNLDIPSTSNLVALVGLDIAEVGVLKLSAALTAKDGQLSIGQIDTNLNGDLVVASISGSVDDLIAVDDINLTVEGNIPVLNKLLKQLNVEMPGILPPNVNISAQIQGSLESLEIKEFNAEIRDEGVNISVSAVVGNVFTTEGIDASFTAEIDSTSTLSKYANLDLPDLGALQLSGNVLSTGKIIRLEGLDAKLNSDNINMQLTGGVSDLVNSKGINADLTADISSLTERNISELTTLLQQFEFELPTELLPQGASFSAKVLGNLDALEVKEIDVEIRDEGLNIALAGQVENALPPSGVDAMVTVKSESLSVFSKYAGTEIPGVGALDASAHVVSSEETYSLENLDATLGADGFDIKLAASINDLLAVSGINAELDSTINSLDVLSDLAKTALPETEPITLNATISEDGDGSDKSANVNIQVESAGAKVALNGLLSDLKSADELAISIAVDAPSLSNFNQFAQRELPEKGPFSLTGTVQAQPKEFTLNDFQLMLDDQSVNGNIGIKLANSDSEHSTLKGELNIPFFDLSPYLLPQPADESDDATADTTAATEPATDQVEEEPEVDSEEPDEAKTDTGDRLFSADPLPLDQLRLIDADFSVTADRLKLGKTDMTDFRIALSLKDGLLNVDPIKGLAGPGNLDGSFKFDGRNDSAVLAVDILLADMPLPNLGGAIDVKIKLDGEGLSIADIMGGLDGRILLVLRDGTIASSFVTSFGSGLFSFSGGKDTTELECAILRVEIEDGFADFNDKLAAQMTEVTWKGGGEINLKTENLDVGIAPRPRTGIGIGGGVLAGLVHIGGTLKKPKIELDPKDVAVKYGKYMAYLSTGGLSLVAEALYNKSQAGVDICAKILDGTVFDAENADAEVESENKKDHKEENKAESSGKRPAS